MPKGVYQKSIKTTPKPSKKQGEEASFVEGDRQSRIPKPKSLTPLKRTMGKKK